MRVEPVIVLVGPTASGKSSLAVDLALELGRRGRPAEIVNADSMLVYRGMDIGTAKPSVEERRGVPHHLVDIMDVTETASVAEFQAMARAAIADIRARGAVPIVVGGSALYTRAVVDVFEFPGADADVRTRWEAELERVGAHALHRRLREIAPASAAKIEPGNGRRIVRALEIAELTGGHEPDLPEWTYALDDVRQYGLSLDRDVLDRRIDERVEAMWRQGLVDEVRGLLAQGLRKGRTAVRAIGYRQVVAMLDGECTEEEAKEATKRATRRFFRKQLGWYRRDSRIQWLAAGDPSNVERIAGDVDSGEERRSGMGRTRFHKGHGTRNDFILVSDPEGLKPLTPEFVRRIADRRGGIGADGVIRAVRSGAVGDWDGDPNIWFMDYHNADGSVAEMCGNGLRVFARYLLQQQLVDTLEFDVATRAGVKHVEAHNHTISAQIGRAIVADDSVRVDAGGRAWDATPVDVGNPHAVAFVAPEELPALDLHHAPAWEPVERFPEGVNLEFAVVEGPDRLAMRVYERGVGETQSCGTGVVAVAAAYRAQHPGEGPVAVQVPGGDLRVDFRPEGAVLTGPAEIVGDGQFWY